MTSLLTEKEKVSITDRIREIIKVADIETITVKGIRKQLEAEDERDYSEDKEFFTLTIQTILEESVSKESPETEKPNELNDYELALQLQQAEEDASKKSLRRRQASTLKKYSDGTIHIKKSSASNEDVNEQPKKRANNRLNKPQMLSDDLRALFGGQFDQLSRPETVKQIWQYIKAHKLQDPSDGRMIICDDKLFAVFKKKRVSCFGMNKLLSAHLYPAEAVAPSQVDSDIEEQTEKVQKRQASPSKSPSKSSKRAKSAEFIEDEEDDEDDEDVGYGVAQEQDSLSKLHPQDPSKEPAASSTNKKRMHPLLLEVPGVTADMPFSVVQATILAYTKTAQLRSTQDPDLIILHPESPITLLMQQTVSDGSTGTVDILELIKRVDALYHQHQSQ